MIAAHDIVVRVGSKTILNLRSETISIAPGEFLAIVGPNGAGKSTLLHVLAGALVPTEGQVTLMGRSLQSYTEKQLACHRAVLAQKTNVAFDFSVHEVVQLGRLAHGDHGSQQSKRITEKNLGEVKLSSLADRSIMSLSGGEQQRVHMARVLTQLHSDVQPRYLFLDEVTTHLDLPWQHMLLKRVRELVKREGIGVIAVLHDLGLASIFADRMLLLAGGKKLHLGRSDSVLREELLTQAYGFPMRVVRSADQQEQWVTVNL